MLRDQDKSGSLRERRAKVRTIAICFIAQNLAMGFAYGSFGPLLETTQAHFDIGRTAAAAGMSLITLAIGLASPMAGPLLDRFQVRTSMIAGSISSAIGYGALGLTESYPIALIAYALIGLGVSWTAILGPLTLVTRWAETRQGKVLSLVNLPLVLFACPYLVAVLLPLIGRATLLISISFLFVILIPLLCLLQEHPKAAFNRKQKRLSLQNKTEGENTIFFHSPYFWMSTFAIGIIAGTGATFVVHLVPYGVERGMSLPAASATLSAYAGAGVLGTLTLGWMIDRIGPLGTIVLATLAQILMCWCLIILDVHMIFAISAALGLVSVPLLTMHGATMAYLFGPDLAGRAVGVGYAIKLPFLFGFPPLAAALFEASGGYRFPFVLCAFALGAASVLLLAVWWRAARHATPSHPPAVV